LEALYRLVGDVQMGEAARKATTSDSSKIHLARRKRVMFASSIKGAGDLGRSH